VNRAGDAKEGIKDKQQRDANPRGESREARADRNMNELLQELRVVQAGVQILVAFLL
jgi:hypothetical protein